MSSSKIVDATELKFDLSKLTVAEYPPPTRSSAGKVGATVLPLVATQCPYGPPSELSTWEGLSFRKLGKVMYQLNEEAKRVRLDVKDWSFNLEDLIPKDADAIDSAVRGNTKAGAAMIAKYAAAMPPAFVTDGKLTAETVLNFNYYALYMPLILKLEKEARTEVQQGFLNALISEAAEPE